ncbi:hypothetical protein LMG28614_01153 [Paraburkholderia ultramafica]|uniref:Uncharacterized protein n=1 Tax=Paraburkholderia ultramafica TaxID=1544867 RepID=A0A6S7AXI6_9BURK|nr:hypothetical protein [Paraburkholderia ultramafica]CAB3781070.1 hypothetical protein LMG28614_01153 [Paraburkholderia ultramafica]
MKIRFASVLLLSLAAHGASAQTIPSATAPRYVSPYVDKHSQLDAMSPSAASATTVYGADSALTPQAAGRYLPSPIHTGSPTNRGKGAHRRLTQPARSASAATADPYSNDLWNAGQTYASPETSDPYSAR